LTTYHFSGTVAWNRLGTFITTGKGLVTKTFTDPSTGLTPAGATQNGAAVTQITADLTTGQWVFTATDVLAAQLDFGAGPFLVMASELPNLLLTASAPANTAIDNRMKWQPSTAYALGQQTISPSNEVVKANTAHTSAAAYATDVAKWDTPAPPRFFTGDKTVYVSPASGSDTNDGRAAGTPLLTLGAALTALSSGGRVMLLPGAHQLSGAVALTTRTDITIEGAGPNLSQVVVNGNYNAFTVSGVCSRIRFKDLWIGSFAARTSGLGISVVGTSGTHSDNITLDNVMIQNTAQAAFAQYVDSMSWDRVKYTQSISSAAIGGSLFRVLQCASHNIDGIVTQATTGTIASDALVLDSDTDTMIVTRCTLDRANRGVVLTNSIGGGSTGPRLVRITDCYIELCASSGYAVTDGRDVRFKGAHAAANTGAGFDISGGTSIKLSDCLALQNGTHGYYVHGSTVNDARLMGCDASNNSQNASVTYDGIRVEDNTSHVRISNSRSGDYVFTLANKQRYGLSIGSTSTDHINASDNDFIGNTTAAVGNFSTGTNVVLHHNNGYNPRGSITAPSVPATTVAQVNNKGFDMTVHVTGGTVTAVAVGGVATGLTAGAFRVPAGQSITLTYSVAPTWTWFGD
jgi:hypothetical protein